MLRIPLSQGYEALIDDEDAALITPFKWSASVKRTKGGKTRIYAVRIHDGSMVLMHCLIMGKSQLDVDHVDADNTLVNTNTPKSTVTDPS